MTDYLNAHLADVERKYDIHVVVHGISRRFSLKKTSARFGSGKRYRH